LEDFGLYFPSGRYKSPKFYEGFFRDFLDALDWAVFAICFWAHLYKTQTKQRVALASAWALL
jgi:hypothetical protein